VGYVNTISEPTGSGTESVRMSTRGSRFTVSNLDFIEATERSLTDGGNDARSVLFCFSAAVGCISTLPVPAAGDVSDSRCAVRRRLKCSAELVGILTLRLTELPHLRKRR
jgi:hypothetical protein